MLTTELKVGKLYRIVRRFSDHFTNKEEIVILFLQREVIDNPLLGPEESFVFLYPTGKRRKTNKRFVEYFVDEITTRG